MQNSALLAIDTRCSRNFPVNATDVILASENIKLSQASTAAFHPSFGSPSGLLMRLCSFRAICIGVRSETSTASKQTPTSTFDNPLFSKFECATSLSRRFVCCGSVHVIFSPIYFHTHASFPWHDKGTHGDDARSFEKRPADARQSQIEAA